MTHHELNKFLDKESLVESDKYVEHIIKTFMDHPQKAKLIDSLIDNESLRALNPIFIHYSKDLRGNKHSHMLGDLLCKAIKKGKLKVIEKLISIPETDKLYDDGWTLMLAISSQYSVKIMEMLLNTEQVKRSMKYFIEGYMADVFDKILNNNEILDLFLKNDAFQRDFGEILRGILDEPILYDPRENSQIKSLIEECRRFGDFSSLDRKDLDKKYLAFRIQNRLKKLKEHVFVSAELDLWDLKELLRTNNQAWIEECAEQFEGVAIWYPYLNAKERQNIIKTLVLPEKMIISEV